GITEKDSFGKTSPIRIASSIEIYSFTMSIFLIKLLATFVGNRFNSFKTCVLTKRYRRES
ncbi:MAG: hypothetical protein KAI29_12860, partial [Cyclobacteriaceae bacterium]|nr:hypothetical protein [Cyclobacteriaceae bacterium]